MQLRWGQHPKAALTAQTPPRHIPGAAGRAIPTLSFQGHGCGVDCLGAPGRALCRAVVEGQYLPCPIGEMGLGSARCLQICSEIGAGCCFMVTRRRDARIHS